MAFARLSAQTNLVPNPSFEDTIQCPEYLGQINLATPWYDATGVSPEYFNACTDSVYVDVPQNFWGNQVPRTGNAYVGFGTGPDFVVNYREYPQVQLTSTLTAGVAYDVEFYVSLSDTSSLSVSSIGLYFSDTAITGLSGEPLNVTPQIINPATNFITDTAGWVLISGTYIANGTENFITIGNFLPDSLTLTVPVDQNAYSGAYYYIDDVSVMTSAKNAIAEENKGPVIAVYPNPGNGLFTLTTNCMDGVISVYNVLGEMVYESAVLTPQMEIDLSGVNSGVYFITIHSDTGNATQKVVIE